MKLTDPLKLVSQLLDLPLLDQDGRYCGIVDDVDLSGDAGADFVIKALLVGPGAYHGRLPPWVMWLVAKLVGDGIVRVPPARIEDIGSAVQLNCTAREAGLDRTETRVRRWLPHRGAL
jgi:sporulation protein YlmC with PRC-barrel domain